MATNFGYTEDDPAAVKKTSKALMRRFFLTFLDKSFPLSATTTALNDAPGEEQSDKLLALITAWLVRAIYQVHNTTKLFIS